MQQQNLDKVNFDSSNVQSAIYQDDTLTVVFKGARTYRYFDVAIEVWEEFKNADSPGNFVNTVLRDYAYERVS